MTDCRAVLITDGASVTLDRVVSFLFKKERYTGYSFFSGSFIGECVPLNVRAVRLYCGGKLIHTGAADEVSCRYEKGRYVTAIRSYGFTMLLGQNLAEPGILSSPSLGSIISMVPLIYGLAYQSGTSEVSYIYINENTTIWDAVRIYTLKAYNTFPFIYGTNIVRCERMGDSLFSYEDEMLTSVTSGVKLTNLISSAYTCDSSGEYSYSLSNEFASERNITKQKYYAQDKEFLYDLNVELEDKVNYADRGREYYSFSYVGYKGEDLLDHITIKRDGLSLEDAEIDGVRIEGSEKGVFTTISVYVDAYCN